MTPNLVLVELNGGDPVTTINLVGKTDAIVIDWEIIRTSSSLSTDEALHQIAIYKRQIYPWRGEVPTTWQDLLQIEEEWLGMAESDDHLTYGGS